MGAEYTGRCRGNTSERQVRGGFGRVLDGGLYRWRGKNVLLEKKSVTGIKYYTMHPKRRHTKGCEKLQHKHAKGNDRHKGEETEKT